MTIVATYTTVMRPCWKRHRTAVFTRDVLQHHPPMRLHRLRGLRSANPHRAHTGDRTPRPSVCHAHARSRFAPAALGTAARLEPSDRAGTGIVPTVPMGNGRESTMRQRTTVGGQSALSVRRKWGRATARLAESLGEGGCTTSDFAMRSQIRVNASVSSAARGG